MLSTVAGCSSTRQYGQYATFADQTKRLANPEKCRIYVYPDKGILNAMNLEICDNNKVIGNIITKSYLCWERDAGQVVLSTYLVDDNVRLLEFEAQKGQVYYICARTKPFASSIKKMVELDRMDDAKALEIIEQYTKPILLGP